MTNQKRNHGIYTHTINMFRMECPQEWTGNSNISPKDTPLTTPTDVWKQSSQGEKNWEGIEESKESTRPLVPAEHRGGQQQTGTTKTKDPGVSPKNTFTNNREVRTKPTAVMTVPGKEKGKDLRN